MESIMHRGCPVLFWAVALLNLTALYTALVGHASLGLHMGGRPMLPGCEGGSVPHPAAHTTRRDGRASSGWCGASADTNKPGVGDAASPTAGALPVGEPGTHARTD